MTSSSGSSFVRVGQLLAGHGTGVCALTCGLGTTAPWNGALVASGDESGTVRLWDRRQDGHRSVGLVSFGASEAVGALCFPEAHGELLVSAVGSRVLATDLRQLSTTLLLRDAGHHRQLLAAGDEINQLDASGQLLAAASDDGAAYVCDLASGEPLPPLRPAHDNICTSVCFAGGAVYSGGLDGKLVQWRRQRSGGYQRALCLDQMAATRSLSDASPGQIVNPPFVHALRSVGGQLLACGLGDGTVAVYSASPDAELLARPSVHRSSVPALHCLPSTPAAHLLLSGGTDGDLAVTALPHSSPRPKPPAVRGARRKPSRAKTPAYRPKVVHRHEHGSKVQALAVDQSTQFIFVADVTHTPSIYQIHA